MPQETSAHTYPPFTHVDDVLTHVKTEDMMDQMAGIRDSCNVYDFLQWLIDPVEGPHVNPNEMDWAHVASLLRIVNRDFNGRLNAVNNMIEGV